MFSSVVQVSIAPCPPVYYACVCSTVCQDLTHVVRYSLRILGSPRSDDWSAWANCLRDLIVPLMHLAIFSEGGFTIRPAHVSPERTLIEAGLHSSFGGQCWRTLKLSDFRCMFYWWSEKRKVLVPPQLIKFWLCLWCASSKSFFIL